MLEEIGEQWKEYCLIVSVGEELIGIVILYIERGVLEEGKFMYFVVILNMCNKGYEVVLFVGVMFVLKEIGVFYYIGEINM